MSSSGPASTRGSPSLTTSRSAKQVRRRLKGLVKSTKQKGGVYDNGGRNLQQLTMHGTTVVERSLEAWGDTMSARKSPSTLRIAFQNIGGQPKHRNNSKSHALAERIQQDQYDIFLFAEHGLNPVHVPIGHQWNDRMNAHLEGKTFNVLGFNRRELDEASWHQVGGCGITVTEEYASMKVEHGVDDTGLGRYCWVVLQGRMNTRVRIVSAYRPVENNRDVGSVWNQHVRYFRKEQLLYDVDPREQMLDELLHAAEEWIAAGEVVIIGIDINQNISDPVLRERFRRVGLTEAISRHHSPSHPPATYNRNYSDTPIDGIWVSSQVEVLVCGYGAFDSGNDGADHRVLWMDVHLASIFGYAPQRLNQRVPRRLRSDDPRLVARYVDRVRAAYRAAHVPRLMRELEALATRYKSGEVIVYNQLVTAYNQLHTKTNEIRLDVESGLRKIRRGGKPWSPKLQIYRDTIELWGRAVKLKLGVKTSHTELKRFAIRLHIYEWAHVDLATAQARYQEAKRAYNKEKANADNWRDDHIEALVEAKALASGRTIELEKKLLYGKEKARRLGAVSKQIRQKPMKEPVRRIECTAQDGTIFECLTQDTIVQACAVSNYKRQTQSASTPFLCEPLVSQIGYLAEKDASNQILAGTFHVPQNVDQYTREFILALEMPASIRQASPLDMTVTLNDHVWAWRCQSERTASEPHGLSFSHYKSVLQDKHLTHMDVRMRSLPLEVGFIPDEWKQITDVEILKKSGVYHVDKMRLIQLMRPDFQINNKMLGRRMLAHAEKYGTIEADQHGSRKHHQAILACLNKVLLADVMRQRKLAGAFCMNDAKSCYDRIVHAPAALCMRRQGVPAKTCEVLLGTLQQAVHHIQTGYGISKSMYQSALGDAPLQGAGQGNGAGPSLWALISTVIISAMKRAGHGVQMLSSISNLALWIVCFAFVDDADTVQTAQTVEQSGEDVIRQLQPAVDRWEGLLRASGGAIEPSKSWWVLVDFVWDDNLDNFRYRSIDEMPGELTVRDHTGTRRTLERCEVHDSNDQPTLGVRLTMSGDLWDQIHYLGEQAEIFVNQLMRTTAKQTDVLYTYQSSFMKTMEYPLTAVTISESQWNSLMAPVIKTVLQKTGFAATFPRDVFFGPVKYQGFGCRHPFYHQEALHIMTFVNEIYNKTQTGQLLLVSLEELIRELGIADPLHRVPYGAYEPCTTNSWVRTLWQFMHQHDIGVDGFVNPPPTMRKYDVYLVSSFVDHGYRGKELRILNQIRQSIHAFTLSDIVTADGKQITIQAWQASGSNGLRRDVEWPRKIPVSAAFRRLWQTALRKCFLNPYSPEHSRTLNHPLSTWRHASVTRFWQWWYSALDDRLYRRDGVLWSVFSRIGIRRRNIFHYLHTTMEKPVSANMPASVFVQGGIRYWMNSCAPLDLEIPPSGTEVGVPLNDLLERWVDDPQFLLEQVHIPDDGGVALAQGIIQGSARAVSDGSYKPGVIGTAACIIAADAQDKDCLQAFNMVPGWEDDQSPYRSELTGIVGNLTLLLAVCYSFDIQSGSVTLALDGDSAMKQAMRQVDTTIPLKADQLHFDLLQVCRSILKRLPIEIKWRWVESHQREKGTTTLDWWARKNDWCDNKAKAFGHQCRTQPQVPRAKLFGESVTVHIAGEKLPHTSVEDLYTRTFGKRTLAYWRLRRQHTEVAQTHVQWDAAAKARQTLPLGLRQWHAKYVSGHLPTSQVLLKRKYQDHAECPRCDVVPETQGHILQCQAPAAVAKWKSNMDNLRDFLKNELTHPGLGKAIVKILNSWHDGEDINVSTLPGGRNVRHAAALQRDLLGWESFIRGQWHWSWHQVQHRYLQSLGRQKTGKRWLTLVLRQFFLIAWDMWLHRNHICHAPGGQRDRDRGRQTDPLIREHYENGIDVLHEGDHHLITHQSRDTVLGWSWEAKVKWLKLMAVAKEFKEVEPDLGVYRRPESVRRQQQFMLNWLNSAGT